MQALFETPPSVGLLVARVTLGVVMFAHGAQKVFGWFGGGGPDATIDGFVGMGLPAAFAVLVMLAETLGSLGLVLGALTRVAAGGILAVMLGAVFVVHFEYGFFMNWSGAQAGEGFEFHLLAIALSTTLLLEGAGALSVDRAVARALTPRSARTTPARS